MTDKKRRGVDQVEVAMTNGYSSRKKVDKREGQPILSPLLSPSPPPPPSIPKPSTTATRVCPTPPSTPPSFGRSGGCNYYTLPLSTSQGPYYTYPPPLYNNNYPTQEPPNLIMSYVLYCYYSLPPPASSATVSIPRAITFVLTQLHFALILLVS
ncbi:hypothetical protein Ccrd_019048 [Cynara cardunculus var. scolymus]|uniref:Uncharacterized protein n=1 Tax=Cynara cardunculus var. scolymus TaxID=59895 RepID=A0A103Y507_CYNCS|nr:hypothetical protein Ccrd_019048 [Cynara cardunculus var. scolymus]